MRYQISDRDLVSEVLDGEVIIIHLRSGTYYSLLASGADIWNALLNGRSVEEIADWLARGAEEERMRIAAEVAQFVSELMAENLILSTDSDPAGAPMIWGLRQRSLRQNCTNSPTCKNCCSLIRFTK